MTTTGKRMPSGKSSAMKVRDVSQFKVNGGKPLLHGDSGLGQLVDQTVAEIFNHPPEQMQEIQVIRDAVEWAMMRRGVQKEDLVPRLPATFRLGVHAIHVSTASKEIIFALAACLDRRISHLVLPSHMEVLRQLSTDELVLLSGLSVTARGTPIATASARSPNAPPYPLYRYIIDHSLSETLEHKVNIPQYIENLVRLGLVSIGESKAAPVSVYEAFRKYHFLRSLVAQLGPGTRIMLIPQSLTLTEFGKAIGAITSC